MASTITFRLNPVGVNAVLEQGGIVDTYLRDVAHHVAQVARANAPVGPKTKLREAARTEPPLKDSIVVIPLAGRRGFAIVVNVSYALAVHNGTKPHVILPKRARVLRWEGPDGGLVFAGRVQHPGTQANPFLLRSLQQVIHP